jgi:hypothetical protein
MKKNPAQAKQMPNKKYSQGNDFTYNHNVHNNYNITFIL